MPSSIIRATVKRPHRSALFLRKFRVLPKFRPAPRWQTVEFARIRLDVGVGEIGPTAADVAAGTPPRTVPRCS
jgi:hypothetical protein